MLSFVIKKTFFDMWDNLLQMFIINIGMLPLGVLIVLPLTGVIPNLPLAIVTSLIGIVLLNLYTGAVARFTMDISDYKKPGFKDFFRYITQTWKQSLSYPLLISLLPIIILFVLGFYFSQSSFFYILLGGVVFWTWASIAVASLYFYPLVQRLNKSNKKAIRTCFIMFFDNTGFSIAMLIGFLIIAALTILGIFMLPGIGTLMLWLNTCFKLRLYKYDYLEENPEADRKKIPWSGLLIDDVKRVGKRTLRGMLFPWKE